MKLKGLRGFCSPNFLDEMRNLVRLSIYAFDFSNTN